MAYRHSSSPPPGRSSSPRNRQRRRLELARIHRRRDSRGVPATLDSCEPSESGRWRPSPECEARGSFPRRTIPATLWADDVEILTCSAGGVSWPAVAERLDGCDAVIARQARPADGRSCEWQELPRGANESAALVFEQRQGIAHRVAIDRWTTVDGRNATAALAVGGGEPAPSNPAASVWPRLVASTPAGSS